jgi:hypothetical protein
MSSRTSHKSSCTLTSKTYLRIVGGFLLGLVLPFALYNLYQDDFGLFWSTGPKRVWTLEKTSKYLMSYRYIPQNFDGLLIGPSFSDGLMDTRALPGYRIYNLSMDAGNSTELRAAALNAIERGHMRVIVICLSNYVTQDSGMKGPQINAKEYWGSLFSWLPVDVWDAKRKILSGKIPDTFAGSEWGMGNMLPRSTYPWDEFARIQGQGRSDMQFRDLGFKYLQDIIDSAHSHQMQVYAYFFPYTVWRIKTYNRNGDWAKYQARARALFDPAKDVVWDMTSPEYEPFNADPGCYTDGHLSKAGAGWVLTDIQRHLKQAGPGTVLDPPFGPSVQHACSGQPGAGSGFDRVLTASGSVH